MQLLPPVLSIKSLPNVDDYRELPLETMFQGKEAKADGGQGSRSSCFAAFSPVEMTLLLSKNFLLELFEYARNEVSIVGIAMSKQIIALLFIHGFYSMPPVSLANCEISLLDVSILFEDANNVGHPTIFKRMLASPGSVPIIDTEQGMLEPLKELFRWYAVFREPWGS
eukprot:TRINITY_DN3097_c0_g3_i1.p1 TRINITY_DN3097_c0_g3~~TRINITY_DN3097_c0_g3_i1.p1  ORF type:complete len:168 (+),score=19.28 TRINITY_DN3097_c0_g3_i1:77-580(+)